MLFGRKAVQREEKDSEERLLTMRYHLYRTRKPFIYDKR